MGLSFFEGTFNVAVPEAGRDHRANGRRQPGKDHGHRHRPDDRRAQADPVAGRSWPCRARSSGGAASKANREKRVAVVFYNYPAGKANIGASYLNVAESLANMLQRLKQDGYDVGTADLSGDSVLKTLRREVAQRRRLRAGRAAGARRAGSAVRVGIAEYRRWLDALSPVLKAKILKDWGEPAKSQPDDAERQLDHSGRCSTARSRCCRSRRAAGARTREDVSREGPRAASLRVATYAWLREGFKADAVVHVGTHGTLEWLDGKDIGLSTDDAPDALIADLPHLYIYNVDVVGEGLVARRRGMAALVDHMVPPFKKGGLYPELAALGERSTTSTPALHKNPELAKAVGEQIRRRSSRSALPRTSASTSPSRTASTMRWCTRFRTTS